MKTKKKIIIAAIVVVVVALMIITPQYLYKMHHAADDRFKPLTCWYCDDPEINIEIYEDGQKSSMVIDGKPLSIKVRTLYSEIHFDHIDESGISVPQFAGEVIPHLFSDDVTVKVFESEIEEVQAGDKFVLHKFDDWF